MKSYIKSKKPIKFGKTIVVQDLVVNQNTLAEFEKSVRRSNPDISEKDLKEEVQQLILKDNYYNNVMDEVSKAYEFELDEGELNEKINIIKNLHPELNETQLNSMAKISIIKHLIYEDLSEDWDLDISDQHVKDTLQNFYKSTGQPIREYLTDKNKFNEVKKTLKEQVISDRLLNAFKANFSINKKEKS